MLFQTDWEKTLNYFNKNIYKFHWHTIRTWTTRKFLEDDGKCGAIGANENLEDNLLDLKLQMLNSLLPWSYSNSPDVKGYCFAYPLKLQN